MADAIVIEKLELQTRVGITPEERAQPQRVVISLVLEPRVDFSKIRDRIEDTIDYAQVCAVVKNVASTRERNLVETLANDIAAELLARFPLRAAQIEARKFALPETASVGVRIRREI